MPLTLSTTMTQVSLISYPSGGRPNLWGVDGSQGVSQYTGNSWTKIPGALVQVNSAPDGTTWGVNAAGSVYRYAGANSWTQMPGNMVHVAVSNNNGVWGINSANRVHRFLANENRWSPLTGTMKQLSAYWSPYGRIWRLWGINTEGHACEYNSSGDSWNVIPNNNTSGTLVQVEIVSDMTYYALDSAGNTFMYMGSPDWWVHLDLLPKAKFISPARDHSFALIDTTGKTIAYDPDNK